MRPRLYWLWHNAAGSGQLTAGYVARLRGIMCPMCNLMWAPFPMDVEVTNERRRNHADRLQEMVLAANPPLEGPDVPLNWVSTIFAGVLRQDLLDIVRPVAPGRWRYGTLSVRGRGVLPGLVTVHDLDPIALRGSSKKMRSVCRECGAFGYIPAGKFYVLDQELNTDHVRGLEDSTQFAITEDLAELIRARFPGRKHGLHVSPLVVRDKPIDGLPVVLPKTWEEYEEWERSQGREPVFPRRAWIPDPNMTIGRWDRQRIARYGMESVFEKPTAKSLGLFLTVPEFRDRTLEMLKQWPKEVRDKILRQEC